MAALNNPNFGWDMLAAAYATIRECPTTKALIEIADLVTRGDAVAFDACVFANTMPHVDDGSSLPPVHPHPVPPPVHPRFCSIALATTIHDSRHDHP